MIVEHPLTIAGNTAINAEIKILEVKVTSPYPEIIRSFNTWSNTWIKPPLLFKIIRHFIRGTVIAV
jgi:hypothetical protein